MFQSFVMRNLANKFARSRLRRLYNKTKNCLWKLAFNTVSRLIVHTLLADTKFLVPMRLGDTPVPISNTMVKT